MRLSSFIFVAFYSMIFCVLLGITQSNGNLVFSQPLSPASPYLETIYEFNSEDEFTHMPGGFVEANAGQMELTDIPTGPPSMTDGFGARVSAAQDQVELLMFPELDVGDQLAVVRVSVMANAPGAAIALAVIDGSMDGSIATNIPANSEGFMGGYQQMTITYNTPGNSIRPIVQLANLNAEGEVTVYFDNLQVYVIPRNVQIPSNLLYGEEELTPIHPVTRTPTPSFEEPTLTPTPTPTPKELPNIDQFEWRLVSNTGPTPRTGHSMVYDSKRKKVILLGGFYRNEETEKEMELTDMWEWNGVNWVERNVTLPPGRRFSAMTYNSHSDQTVLFGGSNMLSENLSFLSDTWIWDGTTWSKRAEAGPQSRHWHAMTYDPIDRAIFLFGGHNENNTFKDMWKWKNDTWTKLNTFGPQKRVGHVFVFDEREDRIILFGGDDLEGNLMGDTWQWKENRWSKLSNRGPCARIDPSLTYHKLLHKVVLFGGDNGPGGGWLGDSWILEKDTWSQLKVEGPSARVDAKMVYDQKRDKIVLFGGYGEEGVLGDTWEFGVFDDATTSTPTPTSTYTLTPAEGSLIPDPNFEEVIRDELNGYQGTLTPRKLRIIRNIVGKNENISNISGVEHCILLETLWLDQNQISSIEPIKDLIHLRHLSFPGNQVRDISAIEKLVEVEYLRIHQNQITDISPLSNLSALRELEMYGNPVQDITPLSNLTNLEALTAHSNNIEDLSTFSNSTKLSELHLNWNSIDDLSPISHLELNGLWLQENEIKDISPLEGMTTLGESSFTWLIKDLNLKNNQIISILPLVNNEGIDNPDVVDLRGNPLNNESINQHIPELLERGAIVLYQNKRIPNGAPDEIEFIRTGTNEYTLTWKDNSDDELGFLIRRHEIDSWDSNWPKLKTVPPNTTKYVDADVPSDLEYEYQVFAYNTSGFNPQIKMP